MSSIANDERIMKIINDNSFNLTNQDNSSLSIQLTLAKFRSFMRKNFTNSSDFPNYDYAIGLTRLLLLEFLKFIS